MEETRKLLKQAVVDAFEPKKDDMSILLKQYKESILKLKESVNNLKEVVYGTR
jgi:hypothetical protein